MDRLIYTAMSGAKQIMEQQSTTAHNLANVSTTGFRAQLDTFRAIPVVSNGLPTRTFVVDSTIGTDFRAGPIQQTGRTLDLAVQGPGWLAVERADGTEGYTRSGSLKINENGVLQTEGGLNVLSDGGPITIPPNVRISFAKDGTISSVDSGNVPGATIEIARLKLVNPEIGNLERSSDGMFVTKDRQPADADANVGVISGAVEGSNVNVVDAMVNMISLARQFELNMKLLKDADSNAAKADQFLALS
ncbi:MAG: flagellar basal-body rod protein FlgF [Burkholderiaceae bacterium]|jgi:flagellar basal-body rod protein FlgF|uniref:Flagellar basal-body rod protein FlgF n=1 Tax=Herminiimonas contaminans TaxID=1111140 RepID=A0ABS0ESV5_9BURK|nr:flagellar basal-body rod protein FlgF [Herminiimonas contaminans]MBF8177134.1 flagellar basal-body rod protein FlgF [Herminiimonas contaminans]MBX9797890.1 flagellar basal-body rod protein FlgF [Burkholderiaceae bacterium]